MAIPGGQFTKQIKVTAVTLTNASAQVIAANTTRGGAMFHNPSATASIALTPVSFGAAALNTAGSITIGPLGTLTLDAVTSFDAFNGISTLASSPLTIWEY